MRLAPLVIREFDEGVAVVGGSAVVGVEGIEQGSPVVSQC